RLPPSANAMSVIAQVHAPRRASTRRCAGASRAVIARNVGMTANGSTMNRIDVKIRTSSIARSVNARALQPGRREYAASSPWAPAHPEAPRARDCTFRPRSESSMAGHAADRRHQLVACEAALARVMVEQVAHHIVERLHVVGRVADRQIEQEAEQLALQVIGDDVAVVHDW